MSSSSSNSAKCLNLTEYMILTDSQRIAVATFCLIVGPLNVIENLTVLFLILISPNLRRKPSYLFISSLATADIFASIFFTFSFVDFHMFKKKDPVGLFLFKLGGVTMAFTTSVGSLLLTAYDRYICIQKPTEYKHIITRKRALVCLLVLWIVNLLISFLPLTGWNCEYLQTAGSELFPYVDKKYLACWVTFAVVQLVLIIYAYSHILCKAHKHTMYMNRHLSQGRTGQARLRMDIKLAKTFGLILTILAFCWSPVLTIMIIDVIGHVNTGQKSVFAFFSMLCLVNCSVNPLIYALRSSEMRKVFQKVVIKCRGQIKTPDSSLVSDSQQRSVKQETVCEIVDKQVIPLKIE
ncbi:cannabinoid receptor 2 [Erpetoichthys calabaricus]|uniref:Cannabinoid receptor 2 n=1 Tax=Erpetoichthys calabaricus TaxID=27687 RepID=A0A8C4T1Y8_ERPCA|nr:cannabinoid receptor 2 [Erpetoichthys calabaricus]XP_051774785.1 cannabinoid receptor 2 [Erpetoichthys calabaricus]XP_051774786.1 cannabinoid receptor 2 [Erpetoichthys calabaricus]